MWGPRNLCLRTQEKCAFGVFLNRTRIALVRENYVINIVLESGARRRNHTLEKYHFNRRCLEGHKNMEVVLKAVHTVKDF